MAKRLFLLIICNLITVATTPGLLMATDKVGVTALSNTGVVETVPLPVEEPEEPETEVVIAATQPATRAANTVAAPVAGQATTAKTATSAKSVNYTVSIYSNTMVAHNLSYNDLYKTGKLVYGHNSASLLGNLAARRVGEIITVTEGGVAKKYRVAAITRYEKTADGYLNGDPYLMGKIMRTALGHDIALLTCAGTAYGNGDASHRLVVYADAAQ